MSWLGLARSSSGGRRRLLALRGLVAVDERLHGADRAWLAVDLQGPVPPPQQLVFDLSIIRFEAVDLSLSTVVTVPVASTHSLNAPTTRVTLAFAISARVASSGSTLS